MRFARLGRRTSPRIRLLRAPTTTAALLAAAAIIASLACVGAPAHAGQTEGTTLPAYAAPASDATQPPADAAATATIATPLKRHVFMIVLENEEQSDVIGSPNAPYLTGLAQQYGQADQYYG